MHRRDGPQALSTISKRPFFAWAMYMFMRTWCWPGTISAGRSDRRGPFPAPTGARARETVATATHTPGHLPFRAPTGSWRGPAAY
jgi:hypothetical protein